MKTEIIRADYTDQQHQQALLMLLDAYARDDMGGGAGLTEEVRQNLPAALARLPHAFSLLAYAGGQAAGLVNCFEGFSTFQCKPLINIHDVIVLPAYRGRGVSRQLLAAVEEIARAKGCAKMTLEVLSNNTAAKSAYQKFGFAPYTLGEDAGEALFWQKTL